MPTARTFRMPGQVIVLDLIGTLLVLVGAFDLAGAQLLGPVSAMAQGKGAILISTGIGMMIIGAVVLVVRLMAQRKGQVTHTSSSPTHSEITTVERRPR